MKTILFKENSWFDPASIKAFCHPTIHLQGVALYCNDSVLDLALTPMNGQWLLEGEVADEKSSHEVMIELALTPDNRIEYWHSACSCAVAHQCKHGVAMLLLAASRGRQLPAASPGAAARAAPTAAQIDAARQAQLAEQARQQEISAREADVQLLRWLQALDQAGGRPAEATAETPGGARDRVEQFLYLLGTASGVGHKGQLQIEPRLSFRKKSNSQWAKPKSLRQLPQQAHLVCSQAGEAEQRLLQLLRALPESDQPYRHGDSASVILEGHAGPLALELAAGTGRLFLENDPDSPGRPVQWGPPRSLDWAWEEVAGKPAGAAPGWVLRARPARLDSSQPSDAIVCPNNPPLYVDQARGLCGLVQAEGLAPAQLHLLLNAPPLQVSALKKHAHELAQRLGPLPLPPMLHLARLAGIAPKACLRLAPSAPEERAANGLMQARLCFDYAGHRGWWEAQAGAVPVETPQGRLLLERDLQAEQAAIARLAALGLPPAGEGRFGSAGQPSDQDWLRWLDTGFEKLRQAGFEVAQDEALNRWISRADALDVQLQPQDGGGGDAGESEGEGQGDAPSPWFDLSLGMEINGQRHNILPWLPELIATAAASPPDAATGQPVLPPFVYLQNAQGSGFIRLPTDPLRPWMAALLELVGDRSHDFSGASLRLSRLDALRTGAALGEGAVWEGAQALRDLVRQLGGHSQLPGVPAPAGLHASLRPYQQHGLDWLQFLRQHGLAGILADDMGLGKTLQTLAHVLVEKEAGRLTRPALVVAPVSLMGNWRREAERFTPGLRTLVLHGKERHQSAGEMAAHDLVIVPYSLLQRDRERWHGQPWHLVVLDEAQNIKNASTHAAQVVAELNTRHRLCLSGTPMENHL
ncbi:MAG: helicase, partial [Polaromonas sp.]|nr:helicase [Polaromonas sp.]